jgi:hypothetical protein
MLAHVDYFEEVLTAATNSVTIADIRERLGIHVTGRPSFDSLLVRQLTLDCPECLALSPGFGSD